MDLPSIHADKTNNRKRNNTQRRNSKTLEEIEDSKKKYSLADLNNALKEKYHSDNQIAKIPSRNQPKPVPQNNRETYKVKITNVKENAPGEVPFHGAQISMGVTPLNDYHTFKNTCDEDDILMKDMDNQDDIEMVSNYLIQQRSQTAPTASNAGNDFNNVNFAQYNIGTLEPTQLQTVYVVDTNFIISQLHTLEELRELSEKYHHVLVIPTTAVLELDGLKSSNSEKIAKHARAGNDWIYKNLAASNSGIIGQKLRQKLDPKTSKDDSILDCCLYFKEKLGCFVILLSNDKNLCLKALTEDVLTVSYRGEMTSELIARKSYEENCARFGHHATHKNSGINQPLNPVISCPTNNIQPDNNTIPYIITSMTLQEKASLIYRDIQFVVIAAIKSIMNDEYGDDLSYIGFEENKLNSLKACGLCIYNYWIAVFSEYFRDSRFKRDDWRNLPNCLTTVPKSQQNIDDLIFFWTDILEHLFIRKTENDYNELMRFFHKWNQFKSKV